MSVVLAYIYVDDTIWCQRCVDTVVRMKLAKRTQFNPRGISQAHNMRCEACREAL
jgi:hypothetical protein